jgi:hypothetical protein
MAKFKVILERVKTITKQGTLMVETSTAEEARRIILADLDVDRAPMTIIWNLSRVELGT